MKTFLKKSIIPLSAILLAILMIGAYFFFFAPKKTEGEKNITVNIVYAENNFSYSVQTNAQTVLEVLKEIDESYDIGLVTESGAYGEFITSLKGVSQDEQNGYYYTYEVKGVEFSSGISTQTIKNNDEITFKYTKDTYNEETWELVSSELQGKGKTDGYVIWGAVLTSISAVLITLGICYVIVKIVKKNKENEQ